jgi:hypothetical protein
MAGMSECFRDEGGEIYVPAAEWWTFARNEKLLHCMDKWILTLRFSAGDINEPS